MSAHKIRLSLELTEKFNQALEELAVQIHGSKSDVFRKSIALLEVAVAATLAGKSMAIISPEGNVTTRITGILNEESHAVRT